MSYFACFNELSIDPLCASAESADQRVRDFLRMWKEARALTHVKKS